MLLASRSCLFLLLVVLLGAAPAVAFQGSAADYGRASGLRELTRGKVFDESVNPHWLEDGERFWFLRRGREGRSFVLVDAAKAAMGPAFDHEKLAAGLAEATGKEVDPGALPFEEFEFADEGKAVTFVLEKFHWSCDLETYACTRGEEVEEDEERRGGRRRRRGGWWGSGRRRPDEPRPSPDGNWEVFVRDHNLYLKSTADEREFRLSHDGTEELPYGAPTWSPDSRHVVAYRVTPGNVKDVYLIETCPDDQLEAKLTTRPYSRPGDEFPTYEMFLFSVETKEARKTEVETIDFGGPPRLRWTEDHRRFTYEKRDRGHQRARILEVDVETGATRTLIDEQAETFIDHYHKHFVRFVDDGKEILWASERDGWNHLYLYDGEQGVLKHQVTNGEWLVRGVDHVDEEKRQIWFRASGMYPDRDPYHVHHYRIDFDGTNLVALGEEDGTHRARWSPDRRYYLDTFSRVDQPPVTNLRRSEDGSLVMTVAEADASDLLATGLRFPEVLTAKGRDGATDIWGIIVRPMDFDPARRYPVIENIYAGPHDSHVPKSFRAYSSMQALAELGFVVVQIDGMGTNNRSKAFLDVCWQNIGDAGFPDRILWLRAAAERYPSLDLERVGIYGTSAGGQNALGGLLFHPQLYKVGVASCGCHDNRLDKSSWNEQWMGYPVGPHYEAQSNVTNANKLEGKLFLILGELDTNVPPESTYRVVDALIEADKDFDLLVVPGMGHGAGGRYGERRRRDFFVRHLLGVEPRWTPEEESVGTR